MMYWREMMIMSNRSYENKLYEYVKKLDCPDYCYDELSLFIQRLQEWHDNPNTDTSLMTKLAYGEIRQSVKLQVYTLGLPMQALYDFDDLCQEAVDAN